MNYANNYPQCAIVEGTGRRQKPLLQPIVTERPFQIIGVDIMELPVTTQGNRYVVVQYRSIITSCLHACP